MPDKPYFLPLFGEFFLKFKSGEQNCEIRPEGHRGWNLKNIYPGRMLLLSYGYGKQDRLERAVRTATSTTDLAGEGIPQWHIDAVEAIYGKQPRWLIAYV